MPPHINAQAPLTAQIAADMLLIIFRALRIVISFARRYLFSLPLIHVQKKIYLIRTLLLVAIGSESQLNPTCQGSQSPHKNLLEVSMQGQAEGGE